MPGLTYQKYDNINLKKTNVYLQVKSTLSLTSFSRYCKDFTNLFLIFFGHKSIYPSKLMVSTYRKVWCLSPCKKSTSSLPSLLRYCIGKFCKFDIFGTLGMPDHGHLKRWYQLVENFNAYLHAKNQCDKSLLSGDITL